MSKINSPDNTTKLFAPKTALLPLNNPFYTTSQKEKTHPFSTIPYREEADSQILLPTLSPQQPPYPLLRTRFEGARTPQASASAP